MPGTAEEAVARHVAGFRVLAPHIERLALVGPLRGTVVAGHNRPFAGRLGVRSSRQGRPVGGARAVAGRFPTCVLIEGIERHTFCIDEGLAFAGVGALGWGRGLGEGATRGGQGNGDERRADEGFQHLLFPAVGFDRRRDAGGDLLIPRGQFLFGGCRCAIIANFIGWGQRLKRPPFQI